MEAEIAALISSVGFPIVAFYLMYRMVNNQMKENTDAIKNNTNAMIRIVAWLENHFRGDVDGE